MRTLHPKQISVLEEHRQLPRQPQVISPGDIDVVIKNVATQEGLQNWSQMETWKAMISTQPACNGEHLASSHSYHL